MYLRNCWYVAAWDHEVGRELMRRTILGEPVVLYRDENGNPVALEDRCAHRRVPLSQGRLKGNDIECRYHGLTYDPSGACVRVPGQATIPLGARVRSYPAVERYHWIWIWMGEAALADPDTVEDFHWTDDPEWRAKGERMHLDGNYMLLVDNLLDLSHLSFLHPTTLGTSAVAETPVKTERDGNAVRVTRWVFDSPPPPFFQRVGGFAPDQNIDRWQIVEWHPPSFVKLDVGGAPVGAGAAQGNRNAGISMRNLNAITPESDKTTHYFWSQARNFKLDQDWMSELLAQQIHTAFMEDLDLIGHQQRNIDVDPASPTLDTNHDAGALQAHRILDTLLAAEAKLEAAVG